MLDWNNVSTVLLDMDGTLLDLHFDNFFWLHHVPTRYAEKYEMHLDDAHQYLTPLFKEAEGTMNWYCVDYWSEKLDLDIARLKAEVDHLIAVHPYVLEFLDNIRQIDKEIILVTNAHQKSLMLKLDKTSLHDHFDKVICSHDFGLPKEEPEFWHLLNNQLKFDKDKTVLVDDTLSVLRSAKQYGIQHCIAVSNPDSKAPQRDTQEFDAIRDFRDLMPD